MTQDTYLILSDVSATRETLCYMVQQYHDKHWCLWTQCQVFKNKRFINIIVIT